MPPKQLATEKFCISGFSLFSGARQGQGIAQPSKCQVEQQLWLALYLLRGGSSRGHEMSVTPCTSQTEPNKGYRQGGSIPFGARIPKKQLGK